MVFVSCLLLLFLFFCLREILLHILGNVLYFHCFYRKIFVAPSSGIFFGRFIVVFSFALLGSYYIYTSTSPKIGRLPSSLGVKVGLQKKVYCKQAHQNSHWFRCESP